MSKFQKAPTKLLGLVILFLLLTGSSCDEITEEIFAPDPECLSVTEEGFDQTIVFIDASGSARGEDVVEQYEKRLEEIVRERMDEPGYCTPEGKIALGGDRLGLFPIHARTESKKGAWTEQNEVDLPEWSQFKSDSEGNKIDYRSDNDRFVRKAIQDARSRLHSILGDKSYSNGTDIWGSLKAAGTEIDTSASSVMIVYFSDMFEAMPGGGRRNFEGNPPRDIQQARQWAKSDVQRLDGKIGFDAEMQDRLTTAEVRVLPGPLAAKDNAPQVEEYWRTFFEELGISEVKYNQFTN